MDWNSYHTRGEILRSVVEVADQRHDASLPMDVEGVREKFDDELDLLGALQLRWHTRLAGRIERELAEQPMDLEGAVIAAWHRTTDEMPGVRAILDHYRGGTGDARTDRAMTKAVAKEHILLAVMAGRGGTQDELAIPVGALIEERARATYRPARRVPAARPSLMERIKAALAA
jgi:hypothetical protein